MSSIDHQMTEIYCFVDDFFKTHPLTADWRHSPNSHPAFTDSEVITIALLQGPLGCSTLKQAYLLVRENWHSAFPHLVSYKQWIGRLHKLQAFVGQLICSVPLAISEADEFYLIDSKPVPLCHPLRHGKVRLLREDGAWFGKTSKGWFFGFKLHMLTSAQGQIISAVFTPANWDDRDPTPSLCLTTEGEWCWPTWVTEARRWKRASLKRQKCC
jgi:Transposase DDE domain